MNKDLFLRQVEINCECEQEKLDIAVNRGLHRAKNERLDPKKLIILAAACIVTLFMCVIVNLNPFEAAVESYYKNLNKAMPGTAEVLIGYLNDITENIVKHLGGE
ncbi:MAG: hypothetical protein FWD24_03340 [Treponema sp.]|nr:hypothetical protein [Treponema sp.]